MLVTIGNYALTDTRSLAPFQLVSVTFSRQLYVHASTQHLVQRARTLPRQLWLFHSSFATDNAIAIDLQLPTAWVKSLACSQGTSF